MRFRLASASATLARAFGPGCRGRPWASSGATRSGASFSPPGANTGACGRWRCFHLRDAFRHLRDAFRSGDVWLRHSRRYADLKSALIPAEVVAATPALAVPRLPEE